MRSVEESQQECDRLFAKYVNEGYSTIAARDKVRQELMDDHSCYPSYFGPYCVICHKDWVDPNPATYRHCERCGGTGLVRNK